MKQNSHHALGAIFGYIAVSIGAITLGVWFLADAENTITAVGAASTIVIGTLAIIMSKRPSESQDS